MSAEMDELISEDEAVQYLGVSRERVRELTQQGVLHSVIMQGPNGLEMMYFKGEVLRLSESIRRQEDTSTSDEEWPEEIGG